MKSSFHESSFDLEQSFNLNDGKKDAEIIPKFSLLKQFPPHWRNNRFAHHTKPTVNDMNYYYVIPGALIATAVLAVIVSLLSRRPLSGLWAFFVVVFLATWAGQLWLHPFGPIVWGIAWFPLFTTSIFFWFLILALIPPMPTKTTEAATMPDSAPATAFGIFFWVMLSSCLFLSRQAITDYHKKL
jgi:hypothetical protein